MLIGRILRCYWSLFFKYKEFLKKAFKKLEKKIDGDSSFAPIFLGLALADAVGQLKCAVGTVMEGEGSASELGMDQFLRIFLPRVERLSTRFKMLSVEASHPII